MPNNYSTTINQLPTVCIIAMVYIYSSIYYQYSFNYRIELNEQYFFSFSVSILILLSLISKQLQFPILISLLVLQLSFLFFLKEILTNEHLAVSLCIFSLCILLSNKYRVGQARAIIIIVAVMYCGQIVTASVQILDFIKYGTSPLLITGLFNNSGVFAIYLVIALPLIIYCLSFFSYLKKLVSPILILLTFIFIIFLESRTALVSFLGISFLYLTMNFRKELIHWLSRQKILGVGILMLLTVLLVSFGKYLFGLKRISASSRLFRMEVCLPHILDSPFTGIGFGKFPTKFPLWQIEYFKTHHSTSLSYFFSANESFLAFNEYLQIFIETGILGLMIFIFAIYLIYSTKFKEDPRLLISIKLSLTAILLSSLTSYTLHVIPNLILLALFLGIVISIRISQINFKNVTKSYNSYFLTLLVSLISSVFLGREYFRLLPILRDKDRLRFENGLDNFAYNGKLLLAYGEELLKDSGKKNIGMSIYYMEMSKHTWISYRTFVSLSKAYELNGNLDKAADNMEMLSYMVPSKFYPRKELVRLYDLDGRKNAASALAKHTLEMPVKVESPEVLNMKNYLYKYLNP